MDFNNIPQVGEEQSTKDQVVGVLMIVGLFILLFKGPWWAKFLARTFVGSFLIVAFFGLGVWPAALVAAIGAGALLYLGR